MIKYYDDVIQGTEEWHAVRCGLLTASEMKLIITPVKLQYSSGEKERAHLYELAAQRTTKYVEPHYVGDDMLRGRDDEIDAKIAYEKQYGPVRDVGFITNDKWGFTLGYSPDGLVGDDGAIECKGRRQKYQMETIVKAVLPDDYKIQIQTGLLVSERKWCDFISYCGGMYMMVLRIFPDLVIQRAILDAAGAFHERLDEILREYTARISDAAMNLIPTERRIERDISV